MRLKSQGLEFAIEFVKKHGTMPDGKPTPIRKLARMLYKENPLLYKDIEYARHRIRTAVGKAGDKRRRVMIDKSLFRTEPGSLNPYNLPKSYKEDREPFQLPKGCNNILLISDLHIPYQDNDAITLAIRYGIKKKVNTVIINGDLIDFHNQSKFEHDPKKRSTKEEFDAARQFLVSLRAAFPNASIYWIKGNHCIRWERFLLQKVKEIWDDPYFQLEERLQLNSVKVSLLDDKTLVMAGDLWITHGHHIMKGQVSPISPARTVMIKTMTAGVIGHVHRDSSFPFTDVFGNTIECFSTGCLCETKPDYSPIVSSYRLGFAHVLVDKNNKSELRNFRITKGKIRQV